MMDDDAKKTDELESEDDPATMLALGAMYELIHTKLYEMAGRPLAFVLTVSDGTEVAICTNMPPPLCIRLLELGHKSAVRHRQEDDD